MLNQVEELKVWQKAIQLVKVVYSVTVAFPKDEIYGLASQMKRAVVSIPANIAEGKGRSHKKEFLQFLFVARGSAYELSTLLVIAKETQLIKAEDVDRCREDLFEVLSMLNGLINFLK